MLEPVSTISNAAFILFGLAIFRRSRYVGLTTIILGIASGGWHWTMQSFWHTFDLGMMYFMLLSLVDYSSGSAYTKFAFLSGTAMIGVHFILPPQMLVAAIAFLLLLTLIRHYPPGSIAVIIACFTLWISTNIPYLHHWEVPFWRLDVLQGTSHLCAAVGIYKAVHYKPTTFSELTHAFKAIHLPSLKQTARADLERIIDVELNPVFGDQPVEGIQQEDISRLLDSISLSRRSRPIEDSVRSGLHQIFEFAKVRGIRHNPVAET